MSIFSKEEKKEPKNLKEISRHLEGLEGKIEKLLKEIKAIKEESKFSIQKVGTVRFNPFSEVGGDQSFSIALLDGNNDGFIITSLYSREENKVYGKPVKGGNSDYSLSGEEKEAIKKAISKNDQTRNSKLNNSATDSGGSRPC